MTCCHAQLPRIKDQTAACIAWPDKAARHLFQLARVVDSHDRIRLGGRARVTTVDVAAWGPDISAFEETWERLYAAPDNEPSTSFEWTSALLRHHVKRDDRVVLLRATRESDPVALLPLVARSVKLFGFPVVKLFPIAEQNNTHSDCLANTLDEEILGVLIDALRRLNLRWDVFQMSNLLEDHPITRHLDGVAELRQGRASYYLPLGPSYDEYLAARSAKFRNHLKRTEKRLEGSHNVQVVEMSAPGNVEQGFVMLLDVERGSWKHAHGTAISAIERQMGFYGDLCRGAAAHGRLRLQLLMLDGVPVAYNLGYVKDGCYFYLKTSYVERHKPLGVATYLRARLIEGLIASGIRTMDFPAEPYEWERQWTEGVRWHKVLTVYRSTPAGYGLFVADRLRRRRGDRAIEHIDPRAAGSSSLATSRNQWRNVSK